MRRQPFANVLALALVASAAVTASPAEDRPWASETFLTDYGGLVPMPSKRGLEFLYVAPGATERFGSFDAVMVDQPEVSVSDSSPYRCAKPDELEAIAEFLRSAVVQRLEARGFRVVDRQGDGVLFLRIALTDLQLKKKRRGVLAYTPIGAVVHEVKKAVRDVMSNVDIIEMAGQAEVSASRTGEVLAAMVAKRDPAAGGAEDRKPERMTFDEFEDRIGEYGDRLACRIQNGRMPPESRVDCTDAAARALPGERSPGR